MLGAILIAGFATLLFVLFVLGKKDDAKIKKAPTVNARVLESVDIGGETLTPYRNTYEFSDTQGCVHCQTIYEERRKTVNSFVRKKAVCDKKNNWTLRDIKRNGGPDSFIVVIVFLYGLAAVCALSSINELLNDFVVRYVMPPIIGTVFGVVSIAQAVEFAKFQKMLNGPNTEKITGTVVWNVEGRDSDGDYTYAPVYEYWIGGERRVYRSPVSGVGRWPIGSIGTLYYNRTLDKIVDKREVSASKLFAIVFGVVAVGLWVYFFCVI